MQLTRNLHVARSLDEVVGLREVLDGVRWGRFEADPDFVATIVRNRPSAVRPHTIVVESAGRPLATFSGIIERMPFVTSVGYKQVYSPTLNVLVAAHGGAHGDDDDMRIVLAAVRDELAQGRADVVWFPSIPIDSAPIRMSSVLGALPFRQHFAMTWHHRRLVLPHSLDEVLAQLGKKARYNLKRGSRLLEEAFPGRLHIARLHKEAGIDAEKLVAEIERVASMTYQRALGVGFAATKEQTAAIELALERRWFRAWTLRLDENPIAFWLGSVYNGTYFSSATGYLAEHAVHSVGTYLLLHVIDDLCADEHVTTLDFGFGDADYKRLLSTEAFLERDLVVFAPTLRGLQLSITRSAILAGAAGTRKVLDASGLTRRLKTAWRRRLRSSAGQETHL
jgi:CelD/BcsL family acetyltransferase involved in cellulose biosynthesis